MVKWPLDCGYRIKTKDSLKMIVAMQDAINVEHAVHGLGGVNFCCDIQMHGLISSKMQNSSK